MTSSSSKAREGPLPGGSRSASPYARFIPREELQGFAAWAPESLVGDTPGAGPATPGADPSTLPADAEARLVEARAAGYREGYRDGLVALDEAKRAHEARVSAHAADLLRSVDEGLQALEVQLAEAMVDTAVALARQVLRTELACRPELVGRVAAEAVSTVLASARRIELHLHPQDLPLVAGSSCDIEAIEARGTRVVADPSIWRGGCRVESDLGRVDARIEARWTLAAAALGVALPWLDPADLP